MYHVVENSSSHKSIVSSMFILFSWPTTCQIQCLTSKGKSIIVSEINMTLQTWELLTNPPKGCPSDIYSLFIKSLCTHLYIWALVSSFVYWGFIIGTIDWITGHMIELILQSLLFPRGQADGIWLKASILQSHGWSLWPELSPCWVILPACNTLELTTSHLVSLNYQGPTWKQRHSYHSGNSKDWEATSQKPETKASQNFIIHQPPPKPKLPLSLAWTIAMAPKMVFLLFFYFLSAHSPHIS